MTQLLPTGISSEKYQQFEQLHSEFLIQYLATPAGQRHAALYTEEAGVAEQSYAQLRVRAQADPTLASLTDDILLKLLPYTSNASNRWKGAWIHHAPVITGDLRGWFESKGWAQPSDWPTITAAIWRFVQRCVESPDQLETACIEFTTASPAASSAGLSEAASSTIRGIQSGILSPILSALRPESFTLINAKSRQTLNYFTECDFSQSLIDYPSANRAMWALIEALSPILEVRSQESEVRSQPATRPSPLAPRPSQLFDLFSHWLVSVRKFNFRPGRTWHLALGEDIWQWEEWQEGGFVAIGWDELGDLSQVTRTEFDTRRERLLRQFKDWPQESLKQSGQTSGMNLAWKFARQIKPGDRVVVMLDDALVLGIGSVTGAYYYVSEIPFGHRISVRWDDLAPRLLANPTQRPMLTLLDDGTLNGILQTPPETKPLTELFADIQVHSTQASAKESRTQPAFLRFVLPIVESLRQAKEAVRTGEITELVVKKAGIEAKELANVAANGANSVKSQIYRARRFLSQAGLIESQARGLWQLTTEGRDKKMTLEAILTRHQEMDYQRRLNNTYSDPSSPIRQLAEAKPVYEVKSQEAEIRSQGERTDDEQPTINHQQPTANEPPLAPRYSLADCAADTLIDESTLSQWVQAIERKGQAIFYGPPGVGKTFLAKQLARHLVAEPSRSRVALQRDLSGAPVINRDQPKNLAGAPDRSFLDDSMRGDGFWELVQFHPAYAYEDFVQGIRPLATQHGISYPMVAGRFVEFCDRARQRRGRCVLIIDEMNRANLSRVFGELMHLLEYRGESVRLAASGELFSIPANVRILGTMNTADRSIALVDHALRRRFAFIALQPNYELLRRYHSQHQIGSDVEWLITLLQRINQQIGDPHYALGVSFFLRPNVTEEIESIWRMEIEPYLEEYFFDRPEQVDALRWERLTR